MNELDLLVVSLETAQKLKEAGWSKPTVFAWIKEVVNGQEGSGSVLPVTFVSVTFVSEAIFVDDDWSPAPTFQELWDVLPATIIHENEMYSIELLYYRDWDWDWSEEPDRYTVSYSNGHGTHWLPDPLIPRDSIAEAAAEMWLWLVENNYIKSAK